ncbi:hypothetical protein TrLO_g1181 [Triparma laevis f. longispina]|uniref:EF-hand domain-containing protein n=1 Tax=Triparma laevis f. longispina TaxID=1714387 RepID=A0A9W7FV28_9STRA|nr:hypothetical protein TrLO_g1181 [Triparma laevis f. longispina]
MLKGLREKAKEKAAEVKKAAAEQAEKNPIAAKVGGSILSSAKNHIVFNAKRVKGMVLGAEAKEEPPPPPRKVVLKGLHLMHPDPNDLDLKDITPPDLPPDTSPIIGKTYKMTRDPTKSDKYNKLVKPGCTMSLSIDRSLVDAQIVKKEKAKHDREIKRQEENEALLHMEPPSVVVMGERAASEGGLWVPKRYAEIKKGDDRHGANYLEGGVELRSLRDLYKLSFTNSRVISRFKEVEPDSDEDSDDDMVIERKLKNRVKLSLYMTKKKPKKRMADIEETGDLILCDTADGFIDTLLGKHADTTTFDVSLKDAPDVSAYKGCVVVKRKGDSPLSDEPVVFGFARFSQNAKEIAGTEQALGMGGAKDRVAGDGGAGGGVMEGVQSVAHYSRLAKNAWQFLELTEEDEINYIKFKKALDLLNIIILEGRASRLFAASDLPDETGKPGGSLSMTEFEVALMMNDAVPKTGPDLTPLDAFYIFDVDGSGEINQTEFQECVRALGQLRTDDELLEIFVQADNDKSGVIDYKEFKKIWCHSLVDPVKALEELGIEPMRISKDSLLNKMQIGPLQKKREQFVHFMNANSLLKQIERSDKKMLIAFDTVQEKVKKVRIEAQQRRDERKRAKKAEQNIHGREAARDAAFRDKEKRAQVQRDQKERAKQRLAEKQMKEKLLAEQQQAKQREAMWISMNRKEKEEFRIKEIRRKGEDKMILKDKGWRVIPPEMYVSADAQAKLSNLVILDLSGNKLVELPESNFLFNLNTLRSFNMSHNRVMKIPKEIANCGSLQIWLIDNNDIRELPKEIEYMHDMVHLDASRNKLEVIPDQIENMYPLRYLILHSNKINHLGHGIGELQQLEFCNLSSNKLRELPEEFSNLTSIEKLDLSNNAITHLPDGIGNLYKAQHVNFGVNQIQVLPESMRHMEKLEIFKMNDNWLQEVPDCVKGWTSVMDMQLKNNRIRRISPEIGEMISLQSFDAPMNQIEAIPAEFGMLTSLQELNLRTNWLTELPPEIGALVSLQNFDVSNNRLDAELPAEFGLLRALRTLNMSHNKIEGLPMSFGALECLEELNMSHNILPAVPQSMMYLQALRQLDCSGNNIKVFPMHLCDLVKLRELNLSSNSLEYLPTSIDMFTCLQKLDLHHNMLRALPLEFATLLDYIKQVDVIQNPFDLFPPKWNFRWTEKEMYQNPSGYSNQEVFEFIKDESLYFTCAEDEWNETGALHFDNRLNFDEFVHGNEEYEVKGVAARMGKIPIYDQDGVYVIRYEMRWHDRFLEHLKRFYFTAKESGLVPSMNEIPKEERADREKTIEVAKVRKEKLVQKAREEDIAKRQRMREIYDQDVHQKFRRAEGHNIERQKRTQTVGACTNETLLQEMKRRKELQENARRGIEKKRMLDARNELERLKNFVNVAVKPEEVNPKRTCPVDIVPCWKSKPITKESLPDTRKGAIAFKEKFSKKERNYDPFGAGGRTKQDQVALARLDLKEESKADKIMMLKYKKEQANLASSIS